MAVGIAVGRGAGVLVGLAASMVATASLMGMLGVGVALPGREQEVVIIPKLNIINKYLIRLLYNFSEQFDLGDVYKGKGEKMKKVLVSISIIILLLSACSSQAQPTDLPPDVGEEPTQAGESLTPAESAAISALSQNLGLDASEITVVSTEAVEWPDACLGINEEETSCAQVVTSGYKIILEANGKQVEYHTDETGTVVLPATIVLTWTRVGGIAGFCDHLTTYLSGEVRAASCKATQMTEMPVTDLLSSEELSTMNEWITEYGLVEIDASDPKGVADGMTVKLTLNGLGTKQPSSPEEEQMLLQFAQNLYQDAMNQKQ